MRRPRGARARKRLAGSVAAVAAMAALTASQAPGTVPEKPAVETNSRSEYGTWAEPRNDDSYHTELPPLRTPPGAVQPGRPSGGVQTGVVRTESGIPATVLAAYRRAQTLIARTDPGCRLPWQLLAAIGKVESGQARGGRVDASGTTLSPILGPVLDGNGFATIRDTDGARTTATGATTVRWGRCSSSPPPGRAGARTPTATDAGIRATSTTRPSPPDVICAPATAI